MAFKVSEDANYFEVHAQAQLLQSSWPHTYVSCWCRLWRIVLAMHQFLSSLYDCESFQKTKIWSMFLTCGFFFIAGSVWANWRQERWSYWHRWVSLWLPDFSLLQWTRQFVQSVVWADPWRKPMLDLMSFSCLECPETHAKTEQKLFSFLSTVRLPSWKGRKFLKDSILLQDSVPWMKRIAFFLKLPLTEEHF